MHALLLCYQICTGGKRLSSADSLSICGKVFCVHAWLYLLNKAGVSVTLPHLLRFLEHHELRALTTL